MSKTEVIQEAAAVKSKLRQVCRTDLLKLCAVLGYRDVNREVHGVLIDGLQTFQGGTDEIDEKTGTFKYKPALPLWALEGSRRNLFLYPRGHLKTTILTIAHTIQWIINYPDIRILLSTATGDQADKVLREIKGHFQFNTRFRAIFPELCPPAARAADFGSRDEFTVPCRSQVRKEPTVWTCSVGKVIAGVHPDVIKNTDLVDKENVKTPGGINDVIQHFKHLNPLLERYNEAELDGKHYDASTGWNDVEGTRYDFGDLYGSLIKQSDWKCTIRAAHGEDFDGIIWPQRFSKAILEQTLREMGDWEYSAQYLNKCVPSGDGLCDPRDVAFVPSEAIGNLMPRLRLHCTVDLAGMEQARSGDFTVLTVGGFDRDGRLYIVDIRCGHYSPELVIDHIFDIHKRYPAIIDFKIEKEAHSRVLLPFLQREMSKRNRYPLMVEIKRDTHQSKQHRIRGLRPFFKNGTIRFNQNLTVTVKNELLEEIGQFPSQSSGVHDDILDTLADMMQNADGGATCDLIADPPDMTTAQFGMPRPRDRFLGFNESGVAQWLYGPDPTPFTKEHQGTGIL